jgi:hypothetical protein
MTSIASATALKGHPSTPTMVLAFACRPTLIAISVAPPPGASMGLNMTLRATDIASARLRSISFKMSFEGPRSKMVQALGERHSVRKVKYLQKNVMQKNKSTLYLTHSSPIFSMLKRPHFVPTSDSLRSSTRLTMVAPTAKAMRLLSDLRTRRIAEILCFSKTPCAVSLKHYQNDSSRKEMRYQKRPFR